ncbi:hypothetical protein G6F22_017249 [Rhizopus arrhizus]|nr:hypothetical protein G6F22_017249 [Rhizopus arrhizus]
MAGQSLPPLKALRVFEAAARLRSFTAAADELSITHSAVSQQIRQLEAWDHGGRRGGGRPGQSAIQLDHPKAGTVRAHAPWGPGQASDRDRHRAIGAAGY